MESWNYFSEEKAFVSDEHETVSPSDYIGRSGRNGVMNWELRTPPSFVNAVAVSGQEADAGQAFGQFGFQELIRKQVPSNSPEHGLSDKFGVAKDTTPIMATLNAYHGEDESTSHFSTSGTQDSLLIDLKLGRFAETREATRAKLPQGTMMLSSSESSTPPKRARSSGVNCHIAYCQVYGCNKDLSSSKDYHKRHKVCEVHSKTSKVIVNGIEQRFCQQCSRFHLLGEFDDGKRSCRKRLTVHNERRRKPQVSVQSGNVGRLLQSYNGNGFARNMLAPTSFMCQDILSGGFMNPEKYGMNNCYERIKAENGNDFGPPSAISIPNKQLNSKPLVSPYNYERQFPLFSEGGINCMSSGIVNKSSQIQHELGGPNSSHSSFQDNSLGSEDFTVFDTASTVPRISGIMESGRALSLLSSRTQNSSSHSSGIPVAHSLVVPVAPSLCEMPDKLVGVSSHASLAVVSNRLSSSATDSAEGNYPGHALISEFEISDGILRGSHLVNCEDNLSCEDGTTMNLLQLSSQLQRVEDQRQSAHVKQENDVFSCPRIN